MSLAQTKEFNRAALVWATSSGRRSLPGRTVDPSMVTADSEGRKVVDAAAWVSESSNNEVRILPRANLTANATTGSAVLNVENSSQFVAGDAISLVAPSATILLALTWANADTLQVTLNSIAETYTLDNFVSLADTALRAAAYFNSRTFFRQNDYKFYAIGETIVITAPSVVTVAVVATTAGDGTATLDADTGSLYAAASMGTVLSVDPDAKTVTLTANSSIAVPAGAPVGDPVIPLGLLQDAIDLNKPGDGAQGIFYSGTVYKGRLYHFDSTLKPLFPELKFLEGVA